MPEIQAPNGDIVSFPEGTDDATINGAMAKAYGPQAQAPQNPQTVPSGEIAPPAASTIQPAPPATPDFLTSLEKSSDQAFDNAAQLVSKIPGFDYINNAQGPEHTAQHLAAEHAAYFAQKEAEGRGSNDPLGNFAGSMLANVPLMAITKNPWALGAASGALGTKDPNDLGGTAIDTATGSVFGKAGATATDFLGNTINPIVKPYVQRLLAAGVKLTPGQIIGGTASMLENGAKYIPVIGDLIGTAQDKALTGFNNAAYNSALSHIGAKLPADITGHEASMFTQKAISAQYEKLLPSLKVQGDAQFRTDMLDLNNLVKNGGLSDAHLSQFTKLMQGIGSRFSGAGGMTGRTMQEVDSQLGQEYSDYRGSSDPNDQKMARAILQAQGNLRELVYRNNPQAAGQLKATREAFKTFVPIELAGGKGSTDELGRFQPGQLKAAIAQNDNQVRNRATAQGTATGEQLANDAIGAMGRTVTSPRSLNPLLRGGAGIGIVMSHLNPAIAAPALAYTDMGGDVARYLLSGRQGAASRAVGGAVRKFAPVAAVAAGVAAPKRRSAVTIEDVHPSTPAEIAAAEGNP